MAVRCHKVAHCPHVRSVTRYPLFISPKSPPQLKRGLITNFYLRNSKMHRGHTLAKTWDRKVQKWISIKQIGWSFTTSLNYKVIDGLSNSQGLNLKLNLKCKVVPWSSNFNFHTFEISKSDLRFTVVWCNLRNPFKIF